MLSGNRKNCGTNQISDVSPTFHSRLPARRAATQPTTMPIGMLSKRSQGCLALERNNMTKKVRAISVQMMYSSVEAAAPRIRFKLVAADMTSESPNKKTTVPATTGVMIFCTWFKNVPAIATATPPAAQEPRSIPAISSLEVPSGKVAAA